MADHLGQKAEKPREFTRSEGAACHRQPWHHSFDFLKSNRKRLAPHGKWWQGQNLKGFQQGHWQIFLLVPFVLCVSGTLTWFKEGSGSTSYKFPQRQLLLLVHTTAQQFDKLNISWGRNTTEIKKIRLKIKTFCSTWNNDTLTRAIT